MEIAEKAMNRMKFICQACGYESLRWLGRCPRCENWNSFVEEHIGDAKSSFTNSAFKDEISVPLSEISHEEKQRIKTGIGELDRVLGGGVVPGSVVVVGGAPGIGKSTLLLQVSEGFAHGEERVLYVSGEESPQQMKLRAERLRISSQEIFVFPDTNLKAVFREINNTKPDLLIIDSIQTLFDPDFSSPPGSITQIRECTSGIVRLAKRRDLPVFLIGHVTKEGVIAGPKLLEHIVDTVLYFEGEKDFRYRMLRTVKNRFGPTNEVGIFEMDSFGLKEIKNPSKIFLEERAEGMPGSVMVPAMEGTRPILVEIQALTARTSYGMAKREVLGVDYNRVSMITAVLDKRVGVFLGNYDLFINVVGGLRVFEPSADLGLAISITSSLKNTPVDDGTGFLGEIGLTGEIRQVSFSNCRIEEAARLGFERLVLPVGNLSSTKSSKKMELIGVRELSEAIKLLGL